jgi:hypothetical protein
MLLVKLLATTGLATWQQPARTEQMVLEVVAVVLVAAWTSRKVPALPETL